MHPRKRRNADLPIATTASDYWSADAGSLKLIAHSGNSVYLATRGGQPMILRLTDRRYRTRLESEAELAFIEHVAEEGVGVSHPLVSNDGAFVEEVTIAEHSFLASMFEYAPGVVVNVGSEFWSLNFVQEWGRSLATLHAASRTAPKVARWDWSEEHLIQNAHHYLPEDDREPIEEFKRVMGWLGSLSRTEHSFGLTHSDYVPGNFHYSPSRGITAFDFGNCCYHWYVWDLAVGLRWLRDLPKSNEYVEALIKSYSEIQFIDACLLENLDWFVRLRYLYIYLDRLMELREEPNDEGKQAAVCTWRAALHREIHRSRSTQEISSG